MSSVRGCVLLRVPVLSDRRQISAEVMVLALEEEAASEEEVGGGGMLGDSFRPCVLINFPLYVFISGVL